MLSDGKDDGRHPGDGLPVIESECVFWLAELSFEGDFFGRPKIGFCLVYFDKYELIN